MEHVKHKKHSKKRSKEREIRAETELLKFGLMLETIKGQK